MRKQPRLTPRRRACQRAACKWVSVNKAYPHRLARALCAMPCHATPVCTRFETFSHVSRFRFLQAFFERLKDEASEDGSWFKGIKAKMKRVIAARKIVDGERKL